MRHAEALLTPGTVLASTYEIAELLGEGGMGSVYRARHRTLRHAVAIKVLYAHMARNEQIRQRFVDEGEIQAQFRHPNLVRVYDIIEEGGILATVMELVAGQTLSEFIYASNRPVDASQGVGIAVQLLSGLGYAHEMGVVHRDIKPDNIFMGQERSRLVPRLGDFGIAKDVAGTSMTVTGTILGTVQYMSPEQIVDARAVDQRSDIYSLGVTLYELFGHCLPFDFESDFHIMKAHQEEPPKPLRVVRPEMPEEVDKAILKALAKDPDDRFQSCREMAEAMKPVWARDGSTRAKRPPKGHEERPPSAPIAEEGGLLLEAVEVVEGPGNRAREDEGDRAAQAGRKESVRLDEAAADGVGAGTSPPLAPVKRVPAQTSPAARRALQNPPRKRSVDARRWARLALLLALAVVLYQSFPFVHCMYEVVDAQRDSGETGELGPASYSRLSPEAAYRVSLAEDMSGALRVGAEWCLERSGFGHGHASLFNVVLFCLLMVCVLLWLGDRLGLV